MVWDLKVLLNGLRPAVVYHVADVGPIDSHAESDRCHNDLGLEHRVTNLTMYSCTGQETLNSKPQASNKTHKPKSKPKSKPGPRSS
jgi:hypothetical protein